MAPREVQPLAEVRPVPDPTVLTTQQLLREIATSREVIETRLSGMDKAIELLQAAADRYPAFVRAEVKQLQELHEEKFSSIGTQFAERDKRTEQLSLADKTAIAAALQAQKEAAGAQNESNAAANAKTETNFAKLIEQNQALLLEVRRNTEAQINDLKSRLDKG
jgi:predicted HTH transcriptional regulator